MNFQDLFSPASRIMPFRVPGKTLGNTGKYPPEIRSVREYYPEPQRVLPGAPGKRLREKAETAPEKEIFLQVTAIYLVI